MSAKHFIDALTGMTLKQAGVALQKYWEERMVKAVRKVLLFDEERNLILTISRQSAESLESWILRNATADSAGKCFHHSRYMTEFLSNNLCRLMRWRC